MYEDMPGVHGETTRKALHRKKARTSVNIATLARSGSLSQQGAPTNVIDHVQCAIHFLHFSQTLHGQTHGTAQQFCQEIAEYTHEQVQLALHNQGLDTQQVPAPNSSISFPVQFCDQVYGILQVKPDPAHPTYPVIPSIGAYLLAQVCGWILYTLKISAFLQTQYQHLSQQASEPLTQREQEILQLLCCGYNQETIANTLSIALSTVDTHRQHIYQKLRVHNGHDMLLAAFRADLFSSIEKL